LFFAPNHTAHVYFSLRLCVLSRCVLCVVALISSAVRAVLEVLPRGHKVERRLVRTSVAYGHAWNLSCSTT